MRLNSALKAKIQVHLCWSGMQSQPGLKKLMKYFRPVNDDAVMMTHAWQQNARLCKISFLFGKKKKEINLIVVCPPTWGCSRKHLQLRINKPGQCFKAKAVLLYSAISVPRASSLLLYTAFLTCLQQAPMLLPTQRLTVWRCLSVQSQLCPSQAPFPHPAPPRMAAPVLTQLWSTKDPCVSWGGEPIVGFTFQRVLCQSWDDENNCWHVQAWYLLY